MAASISLKGDHFIEGVAAGIEVHDAHAASMTGQPIGVRRACFWFYVGVLAHAKYNLSTADEFGLFVCGAKTREP